MVAAGCAGVVAAGCAGVPSAFTAGCAGVPSGFVAGNVEFATGAGGVTVPSGLVEGVPAAGVVVTPASAVGAGVG